MTILDRLAGVVDTLPATAATHDIAEKHSEQIASLERQWQAYINTLPRQ